MPLKFDAKYLRSKKKIAKKIDPSTIKETETLFKTNPSHAKLNLKISYVNETNINSLYVYLAMMDIEFYSLRKMTQYISKIL